jgi:hypothetical protein
VTEQVLTTRALNRALLARQLLLERSTLPVAAALEQIGGIQDQYAPSGYIGLWSRLRTFALDDLTRSLEARTVIQATLMRSTIHLVSREDYWPLALATREARRTHWQRAAPDAPIPEAMAEAAATLRAALADGGALRRKEIEALLGKRTAQGVGLWLDLVRVPPSGTWERRRADLYAAAEDWLGPPEIDTSKAIDLLVRRYLNGFGPASLKDVVSFTGLPPAGLAPVLERIATRKATTEDGEPLHDLPDAPLPDPRTPAPPRFLPTWDATLLVHARRTGLLPEEYRSRVFSIRNPHSTPTFLVDGAVAGTWRYEKGRIDLETFAPLAATTTRALHAEADRLAAFHA